ncbi:hypothetical protein SAMN05660733_08099 [Lentzea albidocapillata]|uniref:Uncharacterized protein n=1 Tax=Lentzea albidocapillata TaxID=40571 RepID=A0A1W2FTK6_9PSEU|nr:hypothetical protein SAMN05660733_08099 [Lentzea albidocapillata]
MGFTPDASSAANACARASSQSLPGRQDERRATSGKAPALSAKRVRRDTSCTSRSHPAGARRRTHATRPPTAELRAVPWTTRTHHHRQQRSVTRGPGARQAVCAARKTRPGCPWQHALRLAGSETGRPRLLGRFRRPVVGESTRNCLAEHKKPLLRSIGLPAIQGRSDHHGSARKHRGLRPRQVHNDRNDILKTRHHQNLSSDRPGADGILGRGALPAWTRPSGLAPTRGQGSRRQRLH